LVASACLFASQRKRAAKSHASPSSALGALREAIAFTAMMFSPFVSCALAQSTPPLLIDRDRPGPSVDVQLLRWR
jgi:hypothetical protein